MGEKVSYSILICPICGKKFIPAPEHIYTIDKYFKVKGLKHTTMKKHYFCGYTCWRKSGGGTGYGVTKGVMKL